MITLTTRAVSEVKKIMDEQKLPTEQTVLRLGVQGGGCSGFSYMMGLDMAAPGDTDKVFEHEGLKVVCDGKSYLYLQGMTVDFNDNINGRGFVFNNPNSPRSCGCGSSFSV